ncbi:MAG: hypothetical protein AVDCRST_MAG02-3303 [uncultured Rubrobacteraceae bacterium]|uniref:Uncharacterized protein n=1 Tax=uncultured Rubrobacteraceae bacterium TaxID=349277 RepID=A0A6J4RFS0_9ACTN|nr:MAG: hypothetical protein AVDCRST_MAG02-3303 [uncultured Rubrobacteraceae bacterium]
MSTPPNAPLTERGEWFLGIGEPKPPSRFWVAYIALLSVVSLGLFFWALLSGAFLPGAAGPGARFFSAWGVLFVALWAAADTGGALLHARGGGASLGRGLRVVGYAVFLPLAMGFYLAFFWFSSPAWLFVVQAMFVGMILARWAVRLARRGRVA